MVTGGTSRKICPVPEFTTSEELALPTGNHVQYDFANDLVYWIQNSNIYRGLSDERYTSDDPCFVEEILQTGKLGRRS